MVFEKSNTEMENFMKKIDVVALGELLIDFTQYEISTQGNAVYEANPGGAPCNVLSMLNNLGRKTAFIGKVGCDMFGKHLKTVLEEVGIDTSGLVMDYDVRTTLAFVEKLPDGDRDFSFYRNPGADMMLDKEEVKEELIRNAKLFHFGTLSMTDEKVYTATKKAVAAAKESSVLCSFDPNIRLPLWESEEKAKQCAAYGFEHCDILKIADNELLWFTGEKSLDAGIKKLREQYCIPLVLLSMGRDGSRAYYKDLCVAATPFLRENTTDTTGAGDTFCACCLSYVLQYGIDGLDQEKLKEMLRFGNAAASIITTRKGALRVMPTKEEVETLIGKF